MNPLHKLIPGDSTPERRAYLLSVSDERLRHNLINHYIFFDQAEIAFSIIETLVDAKYALERLCHFRSRYQNSQIVFGRLFNQTRSLGMVYRKDTKQFYYESELVKS